MNAQKESTSGVLKNSRKPTKKCNESRIRREKNDGRLKYFLMEGRVYKARAENSCHGYQTT